MIDDKRRKVHSDPILPGDTFADGEQTAELNAGLQAELAGDQGHGVKYVLNVPSHLSRYGMHADEENPLYHKAMSFGHHHGLSQEDFDHLAAMFFEHQAEMMDGEEGALEQERRHYVESFGPEWLAGRSDDEALSVTGRALMPVTKWATGLLGPDLQQDPDLAESLADVMSSRDGMRVLLALRQRIAERTPGRAPQSAVPQRRRSREEILYGETTPAVGINHK